MLCHQQNRVFEKWKLSSMGNVKESCVETSITKAEAEAGLNMESSMRLPIWTVRNTHKCLWVGCFDRRDEEWCTFLSMCPSQWKRRMLNRVVACSLKHIDLGNDCAVFCLNQVPCCVSKILDNMMFSILTKKIPSPFLVDPRMLMSHAMHYACKI